MKRVLTAVSTGRLLFRLVLVTGFAVLFLVVTVRFAMQDASIFELVIVGGLTAGMWISVWRTLKQLRQLRARSRAV